MSFSVSFVGYFWEVMCDVLMCEYRCVCPCHLVMLGTVCMTEVQSESRPIFSMHPVMSRKNRKTPHTATIRFIHMRSLWRESQVRINSKSVRTTVTR